MSSKSRPWRGRENKHNGRKIIPLTVGDDRVIPMTVGDDRIIPMTVDGDEEYIPRERRKGRW